MVECSPDSGSRMIDRNCKCHMIIEDQEISNRYGAAVKATCRVLASTDPSQVGKVLSEFFECEGNAVGKFYNLCEATGLITAEQRKESQEAKVGLSIDETLLKGRQFCAEVIMKPNMRKNPATGEREINPEKPGPYPELGFQSFALTSPKAKGIPIDPLAGAKSAAPDEPSVAGEDMGW